MFDGGYMKLLAGYTHSKFQDFQSYLRNELDFLEVDFTLVLNDFTSDVFIHEILPGINLFEDFSVFCSKDLQFERWTNQSNIFEFGDASRRTKLFGRSSKLAPTFDKKSIFNNFLGLFHHEYLNTVMKNVAKKLLLDHLAILDKTLLKGDCKDGLVVIGKRQLIVSSFVLAKPPGYKVFS